MKEMGEGWGVVGEHNDQKKMGERVVCVSEGEKSGGVER